MTLRARVYDRVRLTSLAGKLQEFLPAIILGGGNPNQSPRGEAAQNPAQVSAVDSEFRTQGRCRGFPLYRELAKDATFDQRKRTIEDVLVQDADVLCVKAIEMTHGCDVFGPFSRMPLHFVDTVNYLVDLVN